MSSIGDFLIAERLQDEVDFARGQDITPFFLAADLVGNGFDEFAHGGKRNPQLIGQGTQGVDLLFQHSFWFL
jgi:hypothetical protein